MLKRTLKTNFEIRSLRTIKNYLFCYHCLHTSYIIRTYVQFYLAKFIFGIDNVL